MRAQRLLAMLDDGPRGAPSAVLNPYREADPRFDRPAAARLRRRNLERYLERVGRPRLVLIGEALGYRGGRFSGIAFTSERQLAGGERRLPWAAGFSPTSRNPRLWSEPSASIVWRTLGGEPGGVLLWNAFPWHPHRSGRPLSNRPPEASLLERNMHVLDALLGEVEGATIVAVGRTAERALRRLGLDPIVLRHPAHGGARRFADGLRRIRAC